MKISRKKSFENSIVFVDGLPGCGKTLISSIISSFERVELLSYLYEVEHTCGLFHLDQLDLNSSASMITLATDLKIYNMSMGRDLNFRKEDLSSAYQSINPQKYIDRLSGPGDKEIIDIIYQNKAIFNFAVHNLLPYSQPIWSSLGSRALFLNILRHPVYMITQQTLNWNNILDDIRYFTVAFDFEGQDLPYFLKDLKRKFVKCNSFEKSVFFIEMHNRNLQRFLKKNQYHKDNILTIPFERFVLNPDIWIDKLLSLLGTEKSDLFAETLNRQNIPRKLVNDGIDLKIYKRCGWKSPNKNLSEVELLENQKKLILSECGEEASEVLHKISNSYEKNYWYPGK